MPASLVGAQTKPVGVAQLLGDGHGKSSPKFSHNTDRLPTTFCQPPGMPRHDRHGVDLVRFTILLYVLCICTLFMSNSNSLSVNLSYTDHN